MNVNVAVPACTAATLVGSNALNGGPVPVNRLPVNVFGLGHFNGFGPAKQLALAAAGALLVFGLSLVPLGDRPA